MNKEIKQTIEKYVMNEFEYLNQFKHDEEYDNTKSETVKNISILVDILQKEDINEDNSIFNSMKMKNEITKIENEHKIDNKKIENEVHKNNSDSDLKNKELDVNIRRDIEYRSDRIIKIVIDGMTIIVPIIFYNIWMNKGFRFEETGTYTSNTFKNLFSRFKPTK